MGDSVGDVLRCNYENLSSWSTGGVAYRWRKNGVAIDTATSRTYKVTEGDIGARISCRATATFLPSWSQQAVTSTPVMIK